MNVLDTIDTTVTLEWAETRTVATLLRLADRTATVTALRTPELGEACYLRLEGERPQDSIAVDGTCVARRDGEWGEFEVDIAVLRVGTTASATVLRDFIEQHGLAKGGTVAVGKNRDNPDVKRFVYTMPATTVAGPSGRASDVRHTSPMPLAAQASVPGAAPVSVPVSSRVSSGQAEPADSLRDTIQTMSAPSERTPQISSFAPRLPTAQHEPVQVAPAAAPAAFAGLDLVDDELREMLDLLDQQTDRTSGAGEAAASAGLPAASAEPDGAGLAEPKPVASPLHSEIRPGEEDDGPILVETVAPGDNQPRPVLSVPDTKPASKRGLVARLFGRGEKSGASAVPAQGTSSTAAPDAEPSLRADPSPRADPLSVWDQPVRERQAGRGMVSGSLQAVQQLFSVDQAVRAEKPVTFESGKKKRQGIALRLSESKIRVRAPVVPALYERIVVSLPAPRGGKEAVVLRCEVTRLRPAETEGGEQSFDAKLTGSNDPMTMARLRQLMSEMQPIIGEGN